MKKAAWLLVLLGCSRPGVHQTGSEPLRVSPAALELGAVYLGASSTAMVQVVNPNLQSRTVALSVAPPFFTDPQLVLGGGESKDLAIVFTPTTEGAASATLEVDQTAVQLHATGLGDLACPPAAPCHTVSFDAGAGACVDVVQTDGASCSSNCVENGQCEQGTCRGGFNACDDRNGCSVDSCSEELGCLHTDLDCPEPADPCQAAWCDPAAGCGFIPVQDGVHCGSNDCATHSGRICLNGACTTRPLPAGELCFEVVAGAAGGPGYRDGRGAEARFQSVRSFAVDPWDDVYLIDSANLRKVTPGGTVTTVARGVQAQGYGASVSSIDHSGNVYLSSDWCVLKVSPLGQVSTVAGVCGQPDGGLDNWSVQALSTRDGRLWVLDGDEVRLARPDGGFQTVGLFSGYLGSTLFNETAAGEPLVSRLRYEPDGGTSWLDFVAMHDDGGTRLVRELPDRQTAFLWAVGPDGTLLFSRPSATVDAGCELVEDAAGAPLRVLYTLDGYSPQVPCELIGGNVSTFTGSRYWNATRSFDGGTWVFEGYGGLNRVEDGGLLAVAGVRERRGTSDGWGADAGLQVTAGYGFFELIFDSLVSRPDGGLLWIESEDRLERAFDSDAGVTTIADLSTGPEYGSLQPDPAGGYWVWQHYPDGLAHLDADGVLDGFTPVPADGGYSSFESGAQGLVEPGGGVWLFEPEYAGVLHVAPDLTIDQVLLGNQRRLADGPLADAGFYEPYAPVWRSPGDLVFADANSVRHLQGGWVSTIAGAVDSGFVDGPGAQARFSEILGLAVAPNGDLYLADADNFAIRVIDASGNVRTVGRLTDRPSAVTVTPDGTVWVLVRDALLRGR